MAINILLLLNDSEIKDIVTQAISGLGKDEDIEVFNVEEGQTALDLLDEIIPDLLIAEIFIPGKNGIALCRYVKQQPSLKNLRVVLLDQYFEPFREEVAYNLGADVYLGKPFEAGELSEHIWRLSGREDMASGSENADESSGKSADKRIAASASGPVREGTQLQGSAPAVPVVFPETQPIAPSLEMPAEATPPKTGKAMVKLLYVAIAAVLLTITGIVVAMRADRPQVGTPPQQARPATPHSQTVPQQEPIPNAPAAVEAEEKRANGAERNEQGKASQAGSRAMKSSNANAAATPGLTKVGKNLAGGVKTIGVGGAKATAKAGRKGGGAFKRIF